MGDDAIADPACQVCGRRLLPGERATLYLTRDGAEASVCELCRPRAEAAGWLLPHEAEARGGIGRERRRPRGQMLGSLLSRLPAPANDESRETEAPEPRTAPRARRAQPERPAAPGVEQGSQGVNVAGALAAFNASNHRRTVAGLTRTLGPPRATAIAISTPDGTPGARITVAWEITWYQWEVGSGTNGLEVRESGKGDTVEQLRATDRTWNLLAAADGTLEQRHAPVAEGAEGE